MLSGAHLDEGGLVQRERVAHAAHLHAVGVAPHAELRVLADATLDDLREVLQRGAELFGALVSGR